MPNQLQRIPRKVIILFLICLFMGLAPFFPEPHIIGKIRWILGGAQGMTISDWFDVALHGIPWIIILVLIFRRMIWKVW